jgi:galactokinase
VNPSRIALERDVIDRFTARFQNSPAFVVSAPGRVNLIGEHTDYNGGFVLPAAIDRATAIAVSPRPDQKLLLHAENLGSTILLDLNDLRVRSSATWSNYPAGVAHLLREQGLPLRGATMLIKGDIPRGAGLSSSAALEVASAYAFLSLSGLSLPDLDVVRLCQQAENEFVGVKCGIMDQYISACGREGHALKIDCRSLAAELVPFPPGVRLIVCETGVKRALATSAYNTRREECAAGVAVLSRHLPGIELLRDVSLDDFTALEGNLEPVIRKRCRHVVAENDRVERAVAALLSGNLEGFGQLLYASHESLRADYEVSCPELDAIVEIASPVPGVLGARMTGAGFGGSAICLAREAAVEPVIERLRSEYPRITGKTPQILACTFEDGVTVTPV